MPCCLLFNFWHNWNDCYFLQGQPMCLYIGAIPFVFNLCSTLTSTHSRWAPLYWSERCRNYLPETCIHPRSLSSITLRRHGLYHGDASSILLSSGLFISAYVNPTYRLPEKITDMNVLWAWLLESFFFTELLFYCLNIFTIICFVHHIMYALISPLFVLMSICLLLMGLLYISCMRAISISKLTK